MLAEPAPPSTHDRLLSRADLVFEPKYDGIRALVSLAPDGPGVEPVRIVSRLGNDKTQQFPDLAEPLSGVARTLGRPVLLDGEIVAVDEQGHPLGFQHLQGRLHVRGLRPHHASRATSVVFVAFDLLRDDDDDLRPLAGRDRRLRLEELLTDVQLPVLRLIDRHEGQGQALRETALAEHWEGIVAKDPGAPYHSGRRHASWKKLKFVQTEELVVGGWTSPRSTRTQFGALLLGYYPQDDPDADRLVFAGQVGSGFSQAELDRVAGLLAPRITHDSPFDDFPRNSADDHWVEPTLVVQTTFSEWTLDGLLRHPVYLGVRTDRSPRDVRLPDHRPASASPTTAGRRAKARPEQRARPIEPVEPDEAGLLETLEDLEHRRKRGTLVLGDGTRVPVGNLDKVFWPESDITKGELVRFHLRIAPYVLPVVDGRPLVMKRFPNGIEGKSFYQHRAPDPLPDGLRVASVRESLEKETSAVPYLVGGRLQSLLYMAQLAAISQDPWFSRVESITEADQVALDLDPMPGASFQQVLDVACWLHDELERLGTPSFPKTSGSEGIHIFIPLPPHTPYEAGMIFCQIVATIVATRHPEAATVERTVKKRRAGTVYIDYLQNIYGKTLACAYSARASVFAGVSTPLTWTEVREGVSSGLSPQDFTMRSIFERLDRVGDLWAALRTVEPADLTAILEDAP